MNNSIDLSDEIILLIEREGPGKISLDKAKKIQYDIYKMIQNGYTAKELIEGIKLG